MDLKSKYKILFDRLLRQSRLCEQASKYYSRTKDNKNAKLYADRKMAAESDIQFLLAQLKAEHEPPQGEEVEVSFETQSIDESIKEKDMNVVIDASKTTLPNSRLDYKLKISLECVAADKQDLIIPLTKEQGRYENCITRDLRQQKFFEHRRLKFDLILVETSFFVLTRETVVASGHIKLYPLCTECTLKSEVRLVDSTLRKHSCSVIVDLKLRHPITIKDPLKHRERFVYYKAYPQCGYGSKQSISVQTQNALMVSYVVIEKEIERLSASPDPANQVRIIELEGLRDALQLQVQTGQLTMEEYLQRVKDCVTVTKKRCLDLKRQNDLDQAKQLLANIRLMEDEIKEAMENE